jgi:hypothetical protein
MARTAHVFVAASALACAAPARVVSLEHEGIAAEAASDPAIEVTSTSVTVADPLRVRGSRVVYAGLESALGLSIAASLVPWGTRHQAEAAASGGWALAIEITRADAELQEWQGGSPSRLLVDVDVRATLRARRGNTYLGQTQAGCRESGLVPAERGGPVVARCMGRIGSDLAGWLDGGVNLHPAPGPDPG